MNQAREILKTKAVSFVGTKSGDGHCAFCGYDWGNSEELAKQVVKTSESLKNFSDESTLHKERKIEELKDIYVSQFVSKINEYFDEHKTLDNEQFEYIFDPKNKVEETFKAFVEGCTKYSINIEKYTIDSNSLNTKENLVQELVNELSASINPLTNEYIIARSATDFSKIFNSYFEGNADNITTIEKIQNKMREAFIYQLKAMKIKCIVFR